MDNDNIPQEEKDLEAAASKEAKEEEVRSSVITEYGFDEVDDAEKIQKLVTERMESHKKLTTAIGQKIKYRDAAKATPPAPPKTVEQPKSVVDKDELDKILDERKNREALEELEYPDEIKKEIKRVADIQGTSVRKALSDPYIASRISAWQEQKEADEAAITRKNRAGGGKRSFDINSPPDVDMSTPEGRAEYDEWKREAIKKGY